MGAGPDDNTNAPRAETDEDDAPQPHPGQGDIRPPRSKPGSGDEQGIRDGLAGPRVES